MNRRPFARLLGKMIWLLSVAAVSLRLATPVPEVEAEIWAALLLAEDRVKLAAPDVDETVKLDEVGPAIVTVVVVVLEKEAVVAAALETVKAVLAPFLELKLRVAPAPAIVRVEVPVLD